MYAGMVDAAAGLAGAIQEKPVENGAGINDDGMLQVQLCALILGANDFHFVDQFLGMRIIQKKGEALRGFIG